MPKEISNPLRVVVADSDPDLRRYCQRLIPVLGHQVVSAARSGAELVELCRQCDPDLIVTDNHMTVSCGSGVVELVDSPFSDDEPPSFRKRYADRLITYLVKPIDSSNLANALALEHVHGPSAS